MLHRFSRLRAPLLALALLLAPLLLLTPAATAPVTALTAPVIVLSKVDPPLDFIHGGGTSIEVRNPAAPLELLDLKGQPWLRMNQDGVFTLRSGNWELVRKENFYYISDGDIARQVTDKSSLPYPWRMEGTYGGKSFVMTGTFVPPGSKLVSPGVWESPGADAGSVWVWVLLAVIAVAVVWLIGRRIRRRA